MCFFSTRVLLSFAHLIILFLSLTPIIFTPFTPSFHIFWRVWICPFNVPTGFCAFYHTTNALSGRSWYHGCYLSSMPKGCAVQSIASCCFPDPPCITAWKKVLLWIIPKGEIYWTLLCYSILYRLNPLKILYYSWNST